MRKLMLVLVALACFGLAGCAKPVQKDWAAFGGSRSDAVIKLSYQYNPTTELPQVNDNQALTIAKQRCSSWGYPDVEPFGGVVTACQQMQVVPFAGLQCVNMLVVKQYQCLGRGDSPTATDEPTNKK